MHEKTSDHFPIEADKNLNFISPSQPLIRRGIPISKTEAAGRTVPGFGFIMDDLSAANPKRRPLRAGRHLVVRKNCIHVSDRILKNRIRVGGLRVIQLGRKKKRRKNRSGVGSDRTLEQCHHRQRHVRRGSDGGSIGHVGRIRNGGSQRDGWR